MKISLGLESATRTVADKDFDALGAYADIVAAQEALTTNDMQIQLLTTGTENLESGIALADAIAAKTGDAATAVVVGKEALTSSLRVIGQADLADTIITAGTEDITAATESMGDVLKKMVEKGKELAKKVWEFIRNLIAKVVKFVKGIFGKGDDTAEQLVALLKKAKTDGKTKLDVDEFDEATRMRLAKNVKALIYTVKGDIDGDALNVAAMKLESILDGAKASANKDAAVAEILKGKDVPTFESELKGLASAAKGVDPKTEDGLAVLKDWSAKLLKLSVGEVEANGSSSVQDIIKDDLGGLTDQVEDAIGEDYAKVLVTVTGSDYNKFVVTVTYVTEEAVEAAKAIGDSKDFAELKSNVRKAYAGLKVKTVTVAPDESELKDLSDKIKPVDFNAADKVAKTLKSVAKKADDTAKKMEKSIEKAEKEIQKTLDAVAKESYTTPDVGGFCIQVVEKHTGHITDVTKSVTAGAAVTLTSAVRPKIGDQIKESVRLYVKK